MTPTSSASVAPTAPGNQDLSQYIEELERHRARWQSKPSVRAQYSYWYEMMDAERATLEPSVELGCGCGSLKSVVPDVLATDAYPTPWSEQTVNARAMPFETKSLGNLIGLDILHHIPDPVSVLRECARVLKPGGRLILLEPYLSPWSRVVYGLFHHEPFDGSVDLYAQGRAGLPDDSRYANAATTNLLFYADSGRFQEEFPEFVVRERRWLSSLVYPLTGGFRAFSLLPAWLVRPLSRMEDALMATPLGRLLALRSLIVLERQ